MFAFIFVLLIVWIVMWGFFKFMYPKPPKAFMPKEGDIITARHCDLCGYPLAEYRGVLEEKPTSVLSVEERSEIDTLTQHIKTITEEKNSQKEKKVLSRQEKKTLQRKQQEKEAALFEHKQAIKKIQTWFFCNYDHQAEFHNSQSNTKAVNDKKETVKRQ